MKVVYRTRKKELKKAKIESEKQAAIAKKKKSKFQRYKLHGIAIVLCLILSAFRLSWYIFLIPMYIHLAIIIWVFMVEFYVKRNKERAWNAYVKKYGIDGAIPPHVKMTHKKLIESGKKIAI